jgi:hypothetical protein
MICFIYFGSNTPLCVSRASGDTQEQVVRGIIVFPVLEANPKNGSAVYPERRPDFGPESKPEGCLVHAS